MAEVKEAGSVGPDQATFELWLSFVRRSANSILLDPPTEPDPTAILPVFPSVPDGAPKVIVFAPHPDDEALVGALPLRLRLEGAADVVSCAVTLGSDLPARDRRRREAEDACRVLGFRMILPNGPAGLDGIEPGQGSNWDANLAAIRTILEKESPDVIVVPHLDDLHPTHIGTHQLVLEAAKGHFTGSGKSGLLIESEFWHEIERPNLMVGVSAETEAILVAAAAEHKGEVERNPYHLRHPARMIDNVRRGSEVVGGLGCPAASFPFAEVYRASTVTSKGVALMAKGCIVQPQDTLTVDSLKGLLSNQRRAIL